MKDPVIDLIIKYNNAMTRLSRSEQEAEREINMAFEEWKSDSNIDIYHVIGATNDQSTILEDRRCEVEELAIELSRYGLYSSVITKDDKTILLRNIVDGSTEEEDNDTIRLSVMDMSIVLVNLDGSRCLLSVVSKKVTEASFGITNDDEVNHEEEVDEEEDHQDYVRDEQYADEEEEEEEKDTSGWRSPILEPKVVPPTSVTDLERSLGYTGGQATSNNINQAVEEMSNQLKNPQYSFRKHKESKREKRNEKFKHLTKITRNNPNPR